MRKRAYIVAFFVLRLLFAAGFVWTVHEVGPTLASVTLKVKRYHLVQANAPHPSHFSVNLVG